MAGWSWTKLPSQLNRGAFVFPLVAAVISSEPVVPGHERVTKMLRLELRNESFFLDESQRAQIGIGASYGVLTSSGLWIINIHLDAGKVEAKTGGTWRRPEGLLFVNGRHRFDLVESVLGQVDLARAWLRECNETQVPVAGALCFGKSSLGFLNGFISVGNVGGVWVGGVNRLTREMKSDPVLTPFRLEAVRSSIESNNRVLDDRIQERPPAKSGRPSLDDTEP